MFLLHMALAPSKGNSDNSLLSRLIKSANLVNTSSKCPSDIRCSGNTYSSAVCLAILLSALLALTGCSTVKKLNPFAKDKDEVAAAPVASGEFTGRGPVALETNPPGASVITLGRILGKTPLRVEENDIFPSIYAPELKPIYGRIRFKLKGCKSVTRQMTPEDIAAGVKVDLECGEAATRSAASKQGSSAPSSDNFDTSINAPLYSGDNNVKVRLLRVKNLLEEGLITQDEANTIRRRILEDPSL